MTTLTILIIITTIIATKPQYQICPLSAGGLLMEPPSKQICNIEIDNNEILKKAEIEIFVSRTTPYFVSGYKCTKITDTKCSFTILDNIKGYKKFQRIESNTTVELCQEMVENKNLSFGGEMIRKDKYL